MERKLKQYIKKYGTKSGNTYEIEFDLPLILGVECKAETFTGVKYDTETDRVTLVQHIEYDASDIEDLHPVVSLLDGLGKYDDNPEYRKYLDEVRVKHPEAIFLLRVGEEYRIYGERDINRAGKVIEGYLQHRKGQPEDIVSFPYYSLSICLPKLVRAGYRVVVADNFIDKC